MTTGPERDKAQALTPEDRSAWVIPRLETLPLREALGGAGHPYSADGATFYS